MSIDYCNDSDADFGFDEQELLQTLVGATMELLECPFEVAVSVSVVKKDEIHRLNREYREIDSETDVLSFPMNEFEEAGIFDGEAFDGSMTSDPENGELMLGDIVLCADRIRSQAAEYGHSEKREYAFLVVHSLLHLCGFDHIDDDERIVMEDKQRQILDSLSIVR